MKLTAMKLQAFIREYKGDVLSMDHGNMKIRLGSLGFTRRWGSTTAKQPIDVCISFGTMRSVSQLDGKTKTVHQVSILVVPYGKVTEAEAFAGRCMVMMRDLRAYLLGS